MIGFCWDDFEGGSVTASERLVCYHAIRYFNSKGQKRIYHGMKSFVRITSTISSTLKLDIRYSLTSLRDLEGFHAFFGRPMTPFLWIVSFSSGSTLSYFLFMETSADGVISTGSISEKTSADEVGKNAHGAIFEYPII